MRINRIAATALAVSALLVAACQTAPPGPADSGSTVSAKDETARNLANNCFTCHGPAGRSPGAIPSLAHLSAADIATKLKNFKSGAAPSTVMGRQAKGYSDAEIEALAGYIAGLKR